MYLYKNIMFIKLSKINNIIYPIKEVSSLPLFSIETKNKSEDLLKKSSFVAKRHEEKPVGDDSGGHKEIASLPSNDVTTNANLITSPDIANWPVWLRRFDFYRLFSWYDDTVW